MNILLVSNMYPSRQKPYAGIFVKNQYEQLKSMMTGDDSIDIFYLERKFTSKLGSLLKYLKAFVAFLKFLPRKYDVVHLHFFYPLIYFVWIYKKFHPRTKVVVTFHGKDITVNVNDGNKHRLRKIAKIIDYTIPVGKTLAGLVNTKLKLEIGKILPVGVNHNVFYHEKHQHEEFDFIFVGSFIHRKGIDVVIDAIKKLPSKDYSFCFCGSGEYLSEIEELSESYNITIKQNQTQNELRGLYNKSRFFILMSRNEGFPTATIEAMYCGLPVITSDIPQFKEQVQEGINGFIVPMENDQELLKCLVRTKGMDQSEYLKIQNGALSSFKELSLSEVCNNLYNIYQNLTKS